MVLLQGRCKLRNIYPVINLCHIGSRHFVRLACLLQNGGQRFAICYFNSDRLAERVFQIIRTDFFNHFSVVDKAVMRSKTGQLIENVAGYQNGNTILLIEVQKKLPQMQQPPKLFIIPLTVHFPKGFVGFSVSLPASTPTCCSERFLQALLPPAPCGRGRPPHGYRNNRP